LLATSRISQADASIMTLEKITHVVPLAVHTYCEVPCRFVFGM
jgi:hypothetical protein